MKITLILVITVATIASLCSASPLLVTKFVAKKLLEKKHSPTTTAVIYTPVHVPRQIVDTPSSLHAKITSTLGSFLKHPLLKHPLLGKQTPGGVVEVYHKHTPSAAPYPAAVVPEVTVVDLPPVVEEHHTVTSVVPAPEYGVPAPTYGVPAPTYGVPAPTYGVPAPTYGVPAATYGVPTSEESSSSSASSSAAGSTTDVTSSGAKYIAVNPGARHEAPLPGYDHSVVLENLQPAPGTEGLTMLVPPVVSNDLTNGWNVEPVMLYGQDVVAPDYLRMGSPTAEEVQTIANGDEAKYIAINNGVRHEAPLPGYDHSIVIENLDMV